MADTILSIAQMEDIFSNLTLQLLRLDPDAPASQSRVRITWPEKGAPAWKRTEDVVFLMVVFDDDSISRQMEVAYSEADAETADMTTSYTRVIRVSWILYGPRSFGDADTIRAGLFHPRFKELLAANNLAMVLDGSLPTRSPELFNGQWWDRSTFFARFNELVVRHADVPYIQSGDIRVIHD